LSVAKALSQVVPDLGKLARKISDVSGSKHVPAAAMPLSRNSACQKPPYCRRRTMSRVSRGSESIISAAGTLAYRLGFLCFLLE
jgi:hypothetical protein